MKHIIKRIIQRSAGFFFLSYLNQDRKYRYKKVEVLVKKGVFHPAFFFSTKILLNEILNHHLDQKKLLELGAGSGLISFHAAKKKAIVTASDISQIAIDGLIKNNNQLQLNISIVKSDLFDDIPAQTFDYIIINPPYYPKKAKNEIEKAWFCGEHFEYFEKLFQQLGEYINNDTIILLSLSEDCDIKTISSIALQHHFKLKEHIRKYTLWELNFVFKICRD
jgi:release factor glutamine methyltransferase